MKTQKDLRDTLFLLQDLTEDLHHWSVNNDDTLNEELDLLDKVVELIKQHANS